MRSFLLMTWIKPRPAAGRAARGWTRRAGCEIIRGMIAARWIRLGRVEPLELRAAYTGLAAAQSSGAAPILLWGSTAMRCAFALVTPRKFAPGRASRWSAWALAPAVAACRRLGVPAYLEGGEIWLHGRSVARSQVAAIGECAVAVSGFPARLAPDGALEEGLRLRLEAQHGWQFDHSWPDRAEAASIARAREALSEPVLKVA